MTNKIKELYSALSHIEGEIHALTITKESLIKELSDEYMKLPIREVSFEEQ